MNSKLLNLNAPYNVIYAGGKVGRHIATLITWEDNADGSCDIMESRQYPIIDEGEEYPAGTLVNWAELEDCRTICPIEKETGMPGTNIFWLAKIIEYDFQQLDPAGAEYIIERLKLLDCTIALAKDYERNEKGEIVYDENEKPVTSTRYEYEATLNISPLKASWEDTPEYLVKSNHFEGFYFESSGTPEQIFNDLTYQLSIYKHGLLEGIGAIKFQTNDAMLADVINRLNENQGIESHAVDII